MGGGRRDQEAGGLGLVLGWFAVWCDAVRAHCRPLCPAHFVPRPSCAAGLRPEIPHHRPLPAVGHFQEVQATVGARRGGRGPARRASWRKCSPRPRAVPGARHSRGPGLGPRVREARGEGEGGQADLPGHRLPQLGENTGLWRKDHHVGDHVLQGPWG